MKSMESGAAISGDSLTIKEKTTENFCMRAQDDMPTMREKICYGFGDVSCNIVYGLVASLITLFYTDYVGVSAMTVGLVMIISRCLDGVSDFVMGVIVSKTNSKWGKARPWILWMAVPFGVAAVLLMMVPQTTPMLQFWYILVTYNLVTTVLYTAVNLPYGTMSAMMTRSSRGRDLLGIFRMAMSPFGRIIAVTFTLPLVKMFGSDQMAWVKTMSIWAIIAVVLLLLCFKNCEERVHIEAAEKSNIGLGKNLKALFTNKYFWAVTILWMVQSSYNAVFGTTAPYFCKYILGNDELYSVMYTIEMVVIISGVLFSQVLLRRFGAGRFGSRCRCTVHSDDQSEQCGNGDGRHGSACHWYGSAQRMRIRHDLRCHRVWSVENTRSSGKPDHERKQRRNQVWSGRCGRHHWYAADSERIYQLDR